MRVLSRRLIRVYPRIVEVTEMVTTHLKHCFDPPSLKGGRMKRSLVLLLAMLTILGSFLTSSLALAANAVVGRGSAASCNEAALDNALTTVNSTGGGTMTFRCGAAAHTITLTTQKVMNLANVVINGNKLITLNGSLGVRHFFVGNGVTLTLQNIKLRNGDPLASGGAIEINESTVILSGVEISNNYASTIGGAIYCYGAGARLVITKSLIANNRAEASGGALYNDGCPVTISNSKFVRNTAATGGGAIYNAPLGRLDMGGTLLQDNEAMDGSGLYNAADATADLAGVDFYSNSGGYGGGVENSGTLDITDSLFRENTVTGSGGGLWNLSGSANISRTTFRQNRAYEGAGINSYGSHLAVDHANLTDNVSSGSGGGLYHGGGTAFLSNLTISGNQAVTGGGIDQSSDDNLMMTNATIANNRATRLGGGLYHNSRYAILTNVTIANNTAPVGSAIYEDSPMNVNFPGVVQLVNSVVLGSANNCDGGLFRSLGNNLSQGTCNALTAVTDIHNYAGALNLGALTFNGGSYPMKTMRPTSGSPLIDAGNNAHCLATDQNDAARPQGSACDIGACESQGTVGNETLKNGGFNLYTSLPKIPDNWLATLFSASDGKDALVKREGVAAVKIVGQGRTKSLAQTVLLGGTTGDTFTFSFWVKANRLSAAGLCQAQVTFYSGTTQVGRKLIACPAGATYPWKQTSVSFVAPANYTSVVVSLVFSKSLGTAWFDSLSLSR
jgi:hypothetical protein